MKAPIGLLVALMMVAVGLPTVAPQASETAHAPWWPDPGLEHEAFRNGWNLRIPLTITGQENPGVPVQVHLDLAKALTNAGWPVRNEHPVMFDVVPESVRLVKYTDNWGAIDQANGPEVPFWMDTTWLEPEQEFYQKTQTSRFHPQRNAIVTLEWLLPEALGSQGQFYFVYFDIKQNAPPQDDFDPKAEPPVFSRAAVERLEGLYWVGAGTTLYGHYGQMTSANRLMIFATRDGTTNVEVHAHRGRAEPALDNRMDSGGPNPQFMLNDDSPVAHYSLGLEATHFQIKADKPVTVMYHSLNAGSTERAPGQTFVPSNEGGLLGLTFTVPATSASGYFQIFPNGDMPQRGPNPPIVGAREGCGPPPPPGGPPTYSSCAQMASTPPNNGNPSNTNTFRIDDDGMGAPFLVQHISVTGFAPVQIPTVFGGPVGQNFAASPASKTGAGPAPLSAAFLGNAWKDATFVQGPQGSLVALSPNDYGGRVNIQYSPQGDSGTTEPAYNPLVGQQGYQSDPPDGRPPRMVVTLNAAEGQDVDGNQVPQGMLQLLNSDVMQVQHTPFGGRHGTDFQIPGPFFVYPFYDNTRIDVTYSDGKTADFLFSKEGIVKEFRAATGITRLEADKPVSAFPVGLSNAFGVYLSAKPGFVEPRIGAAEFRGYVFAITPGEDPVFRNALKGDELTVRFGVQNLAGWSGGVLTDTLDFDAHVGIECPADAEPCPDAVDVGVRFNALHMMLDDHGSHHNDLHISVPDDTPSDTVIKVRVTTTSRSNDQMSQSFDVIVRVKQVFDVHMWFGSPADQNSIATSASWSAQPGDVKTFPFALRNLGSGIDSFDLRMGSPEGGWSAWITDDALQPISPMRVTGLEPGEAIAARLHVRAPETFEVVATTIPIDAISVTSPQATAHITLSASLDLLKDIDLRAHDLSRTIAPGTTERFLVDVINTGEDSVSLAMGLDGALPPGWEVAFDGVGDPANGPLSLFPAPNNNKATVPVRITAPADAPAKTFVPFLLRAEVAGKAAGEVAAQDAVSLSVIVGQEHDLAVEEPAPVAIAPGQSRSVDVTVKNDGNGPDSAVILPTALPGGWTITPRGGAISLAPGEAAALEIEVGVPEGELPGPIELQLRARSGGPSFPFSLTVDVEETRTLAWRPTIKAKVQPGETAKERLFIENNGNVAERVRIQATGPWTIRVPSDAIQVPAGAVRSILVEWDVPADATESDEEIRLTLRSPEGTTATISLPVGVIAPGLEAQDIRLTAAPRGIGSVGSVLVVLHNPASVPLHAAELLLTGAGANGDRIVVDRVAFAAVGAKGSVVAPLQWVEREDVHPDRIEWGRASPAGFQALGHAPIPDRVLSGETDKDAPAFTPLFTFAVAALCLLRRRGGKA